jgi:hypothetical protein
VDLHSWWTGISPALAVVVFFTLAMFVVAVGFLVAAGRLRRANRRKAELWGALESEFGVLVDRIADGAAPPSSLYGRVGPGERVVLLDYLYKSAVQETRPERRSLYASLARPYLPLLAERARRGDPWQRARAVRTLAELAGRECGPVVLKALDDPAPHVAATAARVYAQLELGPVDALLARVERYANWDRRLLRSVLVSFGLSAAPALRERLADESLAPQLRAVCADALATLDYRAAGETALHVLRRERDVDLVAATLRLLRPPATEPQRELVRRLCDAEDDVVRGQAVACLARIGSPSDLERVEAAVGDLSPWVSRSARLGLVERVGGGGPAGGQV